MTHVVKLFGDTIVAEQTGKGTYIVRNGEKVVSPYEYTHFWRLSPKSYALKRKDYKRVDVVFQNGRMFFAADYAYEVGSLGPDHNNDHLIAVILMYGTLIMDDRMDVRLFVPGYPRIALVDEMFIVVYLSSNPGPRARVYDLYGRLLAEGELWDAIYDARQMTEVS
jgi:hypothetical protein